jgi:Integrase core domain
MLGSAIVEHIAWYNGTRLHSTSGTSPAEFKAVKKIKKVA